MTFQRSLCLLVLIGLLAVGGTRFVRAYRREIVADHFRDRGMWLLTEFSGPRCLRGLTKGSRWLSSLAGEWRSVTELRGYSMRRDKFTNEDLEAATVLSTLRVLDLSMCPVSDDGLMHLSAFPNLVELNLSETEVTDQGMTHVSECSRISRLFLMGTGIGDAGLRHLEGMASLEVLYLGGTHVTDDGLACLSGFARLKRLQLSNTRVTDRGLEHLKGFTGLSHLYLSPQVATTNQMEELRLVLTNCIVLLERSQ